MPSASRIFTPIVGKAGNPNRVPTSSNPAGMAAALRRVSPMPAVAVAQMPPRLGLVTATRHESGAQELF